ncbi:hypothetical protein, partial [Paraburkholderia sp. NMBU_R16]|uniref:hypothetical protein n=1 Tax=Paraburkholderia sp. NMBU_R16 TaxID=2698676 RepID=UPI001C27A409
MPRQMAFGQGFGGAPQRSSAAQSVRSIRLLQPEFARKKMRSSYRRNLLLSALGQERRKGGVRILKKGESNEYDYCNGQCTRQFDDDRYVIFQRLGQFSCPKASRGRANIEFDAGLAEFPEFLEHPEFFEHPEFRRNGVRSDDGE